MPRKPWTRRRSWAVPVDFGCPRWRVLDSGQPVTASRSLANGKRRRYCAVHGKRCAVVPVALPGWCWQEARGGSPPGCHPPTRVGPGGAEAPRVYSPPGRSGGGGGGPPRVCSPPGGVRVAENNINKNKY